MSGVFTRRGALLGGSAALLSACGQNAAPASFAPPSSRQFPSDFVWGVATSAYQTEGAREADGRGLSIWDVFPKERIVDGSDASVACQSYERFEEDAQLIADSGCKAHRFSISWTRIVPDGLDATHFNQAGLDHYARVADAHLTRGVTPYATLFHWDLPQQLQERGGWKARDTALRFADYAALACEKLGDRIKHFIVLNEAAVHAVQGHVTGEHAPGLKDASALGAVIHHQNLAQGLAIQAMREKRSDLEIGTTLALMPARPQGGLMSGLNKLAASGFDEIWNGAFLDPLLKGSYPKQAQGLVKEVLRDGDLEITQQNIDFVGVNYYAPVYIRFDAGSPSRIAQGKPPAGVPLDAFGRHVDPTGLYEMLERLRTSYGNPRVLITENGCSDAFGDGPAELNDAFRIDYLRAHLEAVKSAMEQGSPVGGYMHWTLIDNWEWALGYRSKFGLVAMDRTSGARTPKASYAWFKALAESGALNKA